MAESEKNLGYDFEAIDNIRNNLESYRIQNNNGFPILKELIQNANDAEATEMILKFFPGDESADHPLLKNNKGIFVYNNGPFSSTNETAMRTIGGSDKKKDTNKVGKYGLGMKSIYHICDFFFYIVDGKRVEFLNPWYKSQNPNYIHNDWSKVTSKDEEIIRKYSPQTQKGLSILIPGKIDYKDSTKNEEWHIANGNSVKMEFPFGTNKEELIKDLMLCLALLQDVSVQGKNHLTKIKYIITESDEFIIEKKADNKIICKDKNEKIIRIAEFASFSSSKLIDDSKMTLFSILDEKKLIGDKIVGDERLRKSTFELIRTDIPSERKGTGKLEIKFCVFLPLQKPSHLETTIFTDSDYTILINAPYMIDHGRQGMFGYDSLTKDVSEESVNEISYKESASKCWNQLLSQNIVFPHLANLFEESIKQGICSDSDIQSILNGLKTISYTDKNVLNDFSTLAYGFAKKFTFHANKLSADWFLLDLKDEKKNCLLYIPDESKYEDIINVFPSIKSSGANINFICWNQDSYYLLPKEYTPNEEMVRRILNDFSKSNFINKSEITIVNDFLIQLKNVFCKTPDLSKLLISKIKEAFLVSELEELSAVKTTLSGLLNTVNSITGDTSYKIYAVDSTNIGSLKIPLSEWKKMWAGESDFLIVPRILSVENQWNEEAKERFLLGSEENRENSLCQFLIDNHLTGLSQNTVINGIVNVRKYIKKIIDCFKDICIFGIINIRTQSKVEYKNSIEFFDLLEHKRIFNSVGVTVKVEELIYKYAKLLPTYDIYALLSKDDPDNFGIEDTSLIIENTSIGVLESLKKQDYTNLEYADEYKAQFINEVLRKPFSINNNQDDIDFYRFLLAGFKVINASIPEKKDLFAFATECDSRWKKVFEICKSPSINMIPKEYDDCIKFARENWTKLGIDFLNDKSCFEQLNAYSWNNNPVDFILSDKELNNEDFLTSVLEKMSETDDRHKTLFRKLPFQKNYITNEIIPFINDDCYLNKAEINFPKGFKSDRILIKMDENERIRSFQEKFMEDRILTSGIAVKIVLEEKAPEDNYADWIFLNMMKASGKDLNLIKLTVSHKKWIPTKSGKTCALNEVLSSNLLSNDTCDAICGIADFYTLDDLQINEESKKFIIKKELIPQQLQEIFLLLVKKLNNSKEFYISFDSYEELKLAAYNLDSAVKYPIFNIIRELDKDKNIFTKELIFRDFYQKLDAINPSLDQYEKALLYLSNKEITPSVLNLYCRILTKAISISGFNITSIRYPNRMGEWKYASELTASDSDSISDEYLLNQEVYSIIEKLLPNNFIPLDEKNSGKNNITEKSEDSKIETFFNTWRNRTALPKLVDLALYLLRGNFRENAIKHTPKEKFNYLFTQFKYETVNLTIDYWNHAYNREQAFGEGYRTAFTVKLQIPEDNFMSVVSLAKKTIRVPIKDSNFTNPIIFKPIYMHEENCVWLQLNKIPKDAKVSDDYAKNLIRHIFKEVYFQQSEKSEIEIERLFENFCNSSQRTIEGTKERIFDDLFGILPSLSVKNPVFESLNYELTECYDKKTAKTYDDEKFAIERARIIHRLIEELTKSQELEEAIFTAVKQKVHLNQYMPENVLFELFQNADDCVNDLVICKQKLNEQNKKFIIKIEDNKILVKHFGRCINDSLQTTNTKLQGKFRQDLLNMLSLNASDKDSANGHTGKFGLGFKSIYKVCNQPIIRSGELNFKIIAGIYPENIPPLSDMNIPCLETRYELEIIPTINMSEITDNFENDASLLTVFSKQIKEIVLGTTKIKMNYTLLKKQNDNSIYSVIDEINNNNYLLYECNSETLKYKILFRIKNEHIEDISETEEPKLWCLTPLESVKNLPFYLNADFNVDTGRKNLASDNTENKNLIDKISMNFANFLIDSKNTIGENFFSEIYELIVHASNMQEQTFSEFKKFARDIIYILQNKTGIIPSGWGGPTITSTDESVIFYIPPTKYDPNVSSPAKILAPVQEFMKAIDENYYVITKSAADSLPDIISDKIRSLDLDTILNFLKSKELTPEVLGLFLNISNAIPNYHLIHRINNLNTFLLVNEAGVYTPCSQIILEEDAPKECRINRSIYSGEIIDLLSNNKTFSDNLIKFSKDEKKGLQDENNRLQEALNALQNGSVPPLQNPNIGTYTVKIPSIEEVYEWWLREKESGRWAQDIENYYEEKRFPSILSSGLKAGAFMYTPEQLFELEDGSIPKEWCQLLWIAAAQSMPYNWGNRDASNRIGMQVLEEMGVFDDFCNGVNLQDVYDKYLDATRTDETRIRLFEMLLRIHKYRRRFADYYDLWRNLPNRTNDNIIQGFLVSSNDEELSGCGIQLAPGNRTFSIGYRLIIQNLALCGFWNSVSEENMKKLFIVFRGVDEYEVNLDGLPNVKEFYSCLDLPFLIYQRTHE